MSVLPSTLQFFIALIACSLNERMQKQLDYTREEVRALKEVLASTTGKADIRLTDDQRRRLAVKGKDLSPSERRECLKHFVFFGERHLRYVINEYMSYYMRERFHQGLGGKLVDEKCRTANDNNASGPVTCRTRLGGLLNYYERGAA